MMTLIMIWITGDWGWMLSWLEAKEGLGEWLGLGLSRRGRRPLEELLEHLPRRLPPAKVLLSVTWRKEALYINHFRIWLNLICSFNSTEMIKQSVVLKYKARVFRSFRFYSGWIMVNFTLFNFNTIITIIQIWTNFTFDFTSPRFHWTSGVCLKKKKHNFSETRENFDDLEHGKNYV